MIFKKNIKEIVILLYIISLLILGLLAQPIDALLRGLALIFTSTNVFINDYMFISGIGPSFVNASLVGLVGFVIVKANKLEVNGPTIACLFTMIGLGFFCINCFAIIPIVFGVYIYSKIKKQKFKSYIIPALFASLIAPIVSYIAFGYQWGIIIGVVFGIIFGIIIPPFAIHMLRVHSGYLLYDIGFVSSILGLLFLTVCRSFGYQVDNQILWGGGFNTKLTVIFGLMFLSMIGIGLFSMKLMIKTYLRILKTPGTLLTDYVSKCGFGITVFNMGLVGLIGIIYILLIKGDLNGPTIGGVLIIVGFGAFGKHPRNIVPILGGVFIGSLIFSVDANQPQIILAALFATTLAPIAGRFGFLVGVLIGILYLSVVNNVGHLHGSYNVFNNSFASGIIAIVFVAIINGYQAKNITNQDFIIKLE